MSNGAFELKKKNQLFPQIVGQREENLSAKKCKLAQIFVKYWI